MVTFPNTAAGQQLATHYREHQKDAPNSLAITVINKYGTRSQNTGIGSLADRQKVNELYRATVDSKLKGTKPLRAFMGGPSNNLFGTFTPTGVSKTVSTPQAPLDTDLRLTGTTGYTPLNITPELELPNFNLPVANAEPTETGMKDATKQAILSGVTDVASAIIKAASIPDPEPVSVAPRPNFGKLRQITPTRIGPPPQFSATGGSVLGRDLFLGGGEVDGPGGPKEDLVPIWASDQEYVVSANGVKRLGRGDHSRGIEALNQINFGGK